MDIKHCSGCFNCRTKTLRHCTKKDDTAELTEKYISSDLIIWSFPLYTFGMPSKKHFLSGSCRSAFQISWLTVKETGIPHGTTYLNKLMFLFPAAGFIL